MVACVDELTSWLLCLSCNNTNFKIGTGKQSIQNGTHPGILGWMNLLQEDFMAVSAAIHRWQILGCLLLECGRCACPACLFGQWVGGLFEGQRITTIIHFLLNSHHGKKTTFDCFRDLSLGIMAKYDLRVI